MQAVRHNLCVLVLEHVVEHVDEVGVCGGRRRWCRRRGQRTLDDGGGIAGEQFGDSNHCLPLHVGARVIQALANRLENVFRDVGEAGATLDASRGGGVS